MDLESQIQHANKTIQNAKAVKETSGKILRRKSKIQPNHLKELSKIMHNVIVHIDKIINDTKQSQSRKKSRFKEIKKPTAKIITHTKNAKYAAIESKKMADTALKTSNKMKDPKHEKKLQEVFDVQIAGSVHAAKVAESETKKALEEIMI